MSTSLSQQWKWNSVCVHLHLWGHSLKRVSVCYNYKRIFFLNKVLLFSSLNTLVQPPAVSVSVSDQVWSRSSTQQNFLLSLLWWCNVPVRHMWRGCLFYLLSGDIWSLFYLWLWDIVHSSSLRQTINLPRERLMKVHLVQMPDIHQENSMSDGKDKGKIL